MLGNAPLVWSHAELARAVRARGRAARHMGCRRCVGLAAVPLSRAASSASPAPSRHGRTPATPGASHGQFLTNAGALRCCRLAPPRRSRCYPRCPSRRCRGLDADRVDPSGEAYALFHTPDGSLGIASAGMSLALAGMGGAMRYRQQPSHGASRPQRCWSGPCRPPCRRRTPPA
jgi:hypothetical protein